MKFAQIVGLLGLVMVLQACSVRDETPLADDTNGSIGAGNGTGNSSGVQDDDPMANPILSNENYTNIVGYVLTFFGNEQLPEPALPGLAPQDFSNPLSTTVDAATGLETAFYVCSNGGTATRTDRELDIDLFEFTDCQYNDSLFNGQLGFSFGKYGSTREFNGLTVQIGGDASIHEATGEMSNYLGAPCSHNERKRSIEIYTVTQGEQVFEIKDWETSFEQEKFINAEICGDSDYLVIGGQFSVRSAATGGNELYIKATTTITGRAENPTAGVVTITATDASSIALDFGTGDDSTVSVTIANKQGSNTFDEPLTSWINSLLP